ncbi:hypothetical protein CI102_14682 [Trichoderma harzianum]|uniref:Uncharacterized protein n=1 Tax=Trichoderma harzianum CBS 226.95 TaxID=983964 RepID=A0A2T4ATW8_TRIHA|nr:hypothetical protein M431DRAFT_183827 [Trichoderma harzianum CBS 226.95]PKK41755.1 hypothetical protein CI102_14682 [Trichoderma harzianum]PTB60491.1 hypothetical protein M431DRAFT_183827 [Trichoderma harzianum CBS 226.95]
MYHEEEARKSPSPVPHSSLHTLFPPSMAPRPACSELPRYRVMISAVYKELIQSDSTESPGVLPLLWATIDDKVVACNGCLSLPGFVLCSPRSERNAPLQQLTPASTCCFCLLPAAGKQGKGKRERKVSGPYHFVNRFSLFLAPGLKAASKTGRSRIGGSYAVGVAPKFPRASISSIEEYTIHCNAATTDAFVSYPPTVCIQQDSLLTFPTLYSYMQAEIRGAYCWYEHDQLSIQLTSNGIAG